MTAILDDVPQIAFDAAAVRSAMRSFLEAADRLDDVASVGGEPRDLLDLAEAKSMAGLLLRKELEKAGWRPPARTDDDDAPAQASPAATA
jgi:hypothetical protein